MSICAFVPYSDQTAVPDDAPQTAETIERLLDPVWDVATATDVTYRGLRGIALWSPRPARPAGLCAEVAPLLPKGRFQPPFGLI